MEMVAKEEAEEIVCPYCGETVAQRVVYCSRCDTPHHEECFRESGVCCTYACGSTTYGKARREGPRGPLILHSVDLPSTEVEDFPFDVPQQAWADHHGGPIGCLMVASLVFPGLLALMGGGLLPAWLVSAMSSASLMLFAGLMGLPFFLFVMQYVVRKSYRYSEQRNRLEVSWRLPVGPAFTLGLLQGKKIAGLSLENTGNRRVAFSGLLNCYRAAFHRKGQSPFYLPMVTRMPRRELDGEVNRIREIVAAPFVADPSGALIRWLGENALWALTVAFEISAGLILQLPFWFLVFLALALL